MKPGYKYTGSEYADECLRESFCIVTGTPKRGTPFISPNLHWSTFWNEWRDFIRSKGYEWRKFKPDGTNEPDGFWIGIVNTPASGYSHAVVMHKRALWHDPAGERKQRPHAFIEGLELVRLADK